MKVQLYDLTTHPPTEAERERFWAKVQKTDTCWFWTGARMVNGYGLLTIRQKNILAHRMAYYLEYGTLPDKDICHSCDVRTCVNPQHLVLGTRQENLVEMHQKGRWRRDKNNPANSFQEVQRTCTNCGISFTRTISIYREEHEPLCSANCRKEWNRRNMASQFWSKVDRSNPDGCWIWQGRLHTNGYGQIGFKVGRDRLAHRFAWRLTYGDIPLGMHILHSCDNPSCVNPTHLSLGTRSENMQDAARKGRLRSPGSQMRGELHPNSKLSNAERQEIRERHARGESYGDLVKAYHAGKTTIARIVKGIR